MQIRNVRKSQVELHSAVQVLDQAKTVEDVDRAQKEVTDLKKQSQKLVLSLQVSMYFLFVDYYSSFLSLLARKRNIF